jgi:hypothetical protein
MVSSIIPHFEKNEKKEKREKRGHAREKGTC